MQAIEGRSVEQKRELARRLTDAAIEVYGAEAETITVLFQEVPPENFARAGVLALDRRKKSAEARGE